VCIPSYDTFPNVLRSLMTGIKHKQLTKRVAVSLDYVCGKVD
jgi:hypothetical protein